MNMKPVENICNFGEHLTIDGYGGDFQALNDESLVLKCLGELPDLLGMKKLCEPQVYAAPDNQIKDPGGWSGFVVIAESHISLHTFPARGFLTADVYSCKSGTNCEFIIKYFKEKFSLKEIEDNFLIRGKRYPIANIY